MNLPWIGTPLFWRLYVGGLILVAWLAPDPSPQVESAILWLVPTIWAWSWSNNRLRRLLR